MTEADWLTCVEPKKMLYNLRGQRVASARKLRLFACACGRRVSNLMAPGVGAESLAVAERLADGLAGEGERAAAAEDALRAVRSQEQPSPLSMGRADAVAYWALVGPPYLSAVNACLTAASVVGYAAGNARNAGRAPVCDEAAAAAERHRQADLLREVFGKPLLSQRPRLKPAWLTWDGGRVPKIAQAIYDACAFDRLPILADALEEAGCDEPDILGHCRSGKDHVRGCWVVDLIVGKEQS